jgi:hypothetical protein
MPPLVLITSNRPCPLRVATPSLSHGALQEAFGQAPWADAVPALPQNYQHSQFRRIQIVTRPCDQCDLSRKRRYSKRRPPDVMIHHGSGALQTYSGREARALLLEGALPPGSMIKRFVDLRGCAGVTALPQHFAIGGSLFLAQCHALEHSGGRPERVTGSGDP